MISEKEFNHDVALLAGMVGGHLSYIDKITDNKQAPANRINLNDFINSAVKGQEFVPNRSDPANQSTVPEIIVQQAVPDISNPIPPTAHVEQQGNIKPASISKESTKVSDADFEELKSELKTIKNTLQHIDATFTKVAGMLGKVFNFITEKDKK